MSGISGVNSYAGYGSVNFRRASKTASRSFKQDLEDAEVKIPIEVKDLGEVSIKLIIKDGEITASCEVNTELDKTRVLDDIDNIKKKLSDKGFEVDDIDISYRNDEVKVPVKVDDLGEVSIKIVIKDGKITASCEAENVLAKYCILDDMDNIKEQLKDEGYDVEEIDVSVSSGLKDKEEGHSENNRTNNDLDKDAFLRLLAAQLSNQDPLNPIEDKDFIAQMAQFTSLEELQEMNEKLELNTTFLALLSESTDKQNEVLEDLKKSIEELKDEQSKSLENDLETINQLIKLNKAMEGYDMGSGE